MEAVKFPELGRQMGSPLLTMVETDRRGAVKHLSKIEDPGYDLKGILLAVLAGEMQAFELVYEGRGVGAFVWSIEKDQFETVLVVNALAAEPIEGVDITDEVVNMLKGVGAAVGADLVRFWTSREGLVRRVEAMGFRRRYVMEGRI